MPEENSHKRKVQLSWSDPTLRLSLVLMTSHSEPVSVGWLILIHRLLINWAERKKKTKKVSENSDIILFPAGEFSYLVTVRDMIWVTENSLY